VRAGYGIDRGADGVTRCATACISAWSRTVGRPKRKSSSTQDECSAFRTLINPNSILTVVFLQVPK